MAVRSDIDEVRRPLWFPLIDGIGFSATIGACAERRTAGSQLHGQEWMCLAISFGKIAGNEEAFTIRVIHFHGSSWAKRGWLGITRSRILFGPFDAMVVVRS
jgi:hypothetical protein